MKPDHVCIQIKDLEVFAHHGVFDYEKKDGQKFYISLNTYLEVARAAKDDSLDHTVSYGDLSHEIHTYVKDHCFDLIETLAEGLAVTLLASHESLLKVEVLVKKPDAPIGLPLAYPAVEIHKERVKAYIGLGSNIGDTKAHLDLAIEEIGDIHGVTLKKVAPYMITKPWGGVEQDDFLNSVLEIETYLSPYTLLAKLQEIEASHDRKRQVHWGPRTLDLDILLYGELVTEDQDLVIPHPYLHKRDFVLKPLCDLNPNIVHPLYRLRLIDILEKMGQE